MTGRADAPVARRYPFGIVNERKQIVLTGVACIFAGTPICMIALDFLAYDEDKIHAPDWVLLLAGGVFILGGLALLLQNRPLIVSLLGNLIVVSFAAIAAWVAMSGPSEQFSGGVPFLPHEFNVKIARIVFACVALLCALMLIPGLKHLLKHISED